LSNLAISPESGSDMTATLQAASSLVKEFNAFPISPRPLRAETDHEIANGVDTVNAALKGIEELNGKLARIDRTSGQAAALMDERGRLLDQISDYLPIQTVQRQSGGIDIVTQEGVYLLQSTANEIEFTPSTVFGPRKHWQVAACLD
jgi:flagellar hook-associated protein 1 FlgK